MGQTFYFCSHNCVDQFDTDPHKYTMADSITTGYNPALPLTRVELPIIGLKKTDRAQALEGVLQAVTLDALSKAVKSAGFRVGGAQTRIGIADLHCALARSNRSAINQWRGTMTPAQITITMAGIALSLFIARFFWFAPKTKTQEVAVTVKAATRLISLS